MFTGIVSGIGRIVEVHPLGTDASFGKALTIEAPAGWLGRSAIGDSIALAGACMTVDLDRRRAPSLPGRGLGREPRRHRTASTRPATSISRRPCAPATGSTATWSAATSTASARSTRFERAGESWLLEVAAPPALARYLALQGSIAVDGVSLTVNRVADSADGLRLQRQPDPAHGRAHHLARPGRRPPRQSRGRPIARYVERMLAARAVLTLPAHAPVPPPTISTIMSIAPIPELVAELAAGRMVILVDEEDRENEGDLVLAADRVTPEAINFMARFARGLICLTLTRERCERLQLPPMTAQERRPARHRVHGLDRGRERRHDRHLGGRPRPHGAGRGRARTPRPSDLVQPGHIFPLHGAGRRRADARRPHRSRLRPRRAWPA